MLSLWCEDLGRLLLLRHQKNRSNDTQTPPGQNNNNNNINNNNGAKSPDSMQVNTQIQKSLTPGPTGDNGMAWPQQGSQQASQLSVVTTVWGVTNTVSTQSAPYNNAFSNTGPGFTSTTMSSNYTPPGQPLPGSQMGQKVPYGSPGPQGMGYVPQGGRNSAGPYPRGGGYPPTPNTPGGMGPTANGPMTNGPMANGPMANGPMAGNGQDFQPPPGALSAAAMVAAAATATATATATASMVALQEQQNQQQQMQGMGMGMNNGHAQYPGPPNHMHNQHLPPNQPGMQAGMRPGGPHMGMNQMPMGGGPMKNMPPGMYGGPRGRPSPYPNPQQYLQNKRQQYSNGQQYPMGQYGHPQYGPRPSYPSQQPMSPTYPAQHPGMRPSYGPAGGPGPYMNQQYRGQVPPYSHPNFQNNMANMQGGPGPGGPGPMSTMGTMNSMGPYQHHSPIPGNPTPPMTPNVLPPYMSPNPGPGGPPQQDMKPNFQDIKPNMQQPFKKEADELRLTFPVRDGVVLPPFRLEHNLAVSNHVFHLRESVYQTLMWRSDLELQLKCFHHEDRQMSTNWPASVTVSVNATPLSIERGENKTSHKPLYLKEVCQPGRNTIQITVTACCCSHLFVLQLVHRPSVRSIMQGLLRKRLLPAEHCITKIKRNFTSVNSTTNSNSSAMNGSTPSEDGVEQTAIKVSLKCPITFRRMSLPARGHDCKHIQCFDLESYLQLNCERGAWRCPVCNKPALLEGLEVDQYIWGILTNLMGTEFEEVTIDPTASWKPVMLKSAIKEEESDGCASRWLKAMSPSSTQLPTMNSWDFGPASSPYPNIPPTSQGGRGTPNTLYNNGQPYSNPGNPGTPNSFAGNGFSSPPLNHIPDSIGPELNQDAFRVSGARTPTTQSVFQNGPISNQSGSSSQPNTPGTANPGTPNYSSSSSTGLSTQSISQSSAGTPLTNGIDQSTPVDSAGSNHVTDTSNVLPFDPAAIIEGEGQGQEALDLLPENIGDPMELLSYLGPPDNTVNASGPNGGSNVSDDLLALFET